MEQNMDAPLEAQDAAKLVAAFERVARMSPDPAWNSAAPSWSALSRQGAAAAKTADFSAAQATCKSCHRAFRKPFKALHRAKPLPL
jgi:cytochrome c556